MCIVYLYFYRAVKAQNFDRDRLPYKGWLQPFSAWYGMISMSVIVACYGYYVFLPGSWDVGNFFIYYLMLFVCIFLYVGWKPVKRTKVVPARDVDLVWEAPSVDAYEATLVPETGFWQNSVKRLRSKTRGFSGE